MRQAILLLFFVFLVTPPAYADSHDCVRAALSDAEVVAGVKEVDDRFDFIFLLCGGATNRAPIQCYKKAAADKDLFSKYDTWKRADLIVQLCAGANSLKPIACVKAATADKSIAAPNRDIKWHQLFFAGLCRKAKDLSPIACFKKALGDASLWERTKALHIFTDFYKYRDISAFCGTLPDFKVDDREALLGIPGKGNFSP